MRIRAGLRWFGVATGTIVVVLGCAYFYAIAPHHSFAPPESAAGLLERADELAWGNEWAEAQPLYAKAERLFESQHQPSKALYAQVTASNSLACSLVNQFPIRVPACRMFGIEVS